MTTLTHTNTADMSDALARRMAARLDAASMELPRDITERLRAARTRAVAARLMPQTRLQASRAVSVQSGVGTLHFGDEGLNLWSRLAALLPLISLVAGLAVIQHIMDDIRANELAEVDSAMLADDLPPTAYADPGFLQFLKTPLSDSERQE